MERLGSRRGEGSDRGVLAFFENTGLWKQCCCWKIVSVHMQLERETITSAGINQRLSVGFTSHCPSSKASPGMVLVACSGLGGATICYIPGTMGFLFWDCPGEEKGLWLNWIDQLSPRACLICSLCTLTQSASLLYLQMCTFSRCFLFHPQIPPRDCGSVCIALNCHSP